MILLMEAELRDALDKLAQWGFAEPFRDYAAPVRGYHGLTARQEAWALTRKGRGIVAAVRSAVVDAGRALQLPSRLLDSVEHTIRGMLRHLGHNDGLLPVDLDDTRTRIEEMQRVTADFYTALAQMVQSDVTDDGLFGENRDRVIEALRQFPREYGRALRRVEAALADLREAGHRRLVEASVPHAGLVDARDEHYWVDERVRRLSDLEAWFEPDGTVRRLVASATGAVYTLLVAIDRRHAARRRGSDLGPISGLWLTAFTASRATLKPAGSTRRHSVTGRRGTRYAARRKRTWRTDRPQKLAAGGTRST